MPGMKIHLFGKFCVSRDGQPVQGFDALKEQELLTYLLINRNRPHSREILAGVLWGEVPTERSKKYLRQALWHLQAALEAQPRGERDGAVLSVEHNWVQLNTVSALWLDVAVFEQAFMRTHDSAGAELAADCVESLQEAVQLYRGDLVEGWYHDWCLYERERLQNMYLAMLDKLVCYYEAHRKFELGLLYGSIILRYDRAHERTHRHLMSLQYLSGNRTAALRQFERCVAALDEELGVRPDKHTTALYQKIRAADGEQDAASLPAPPETDEAGAVSLNDVLRRLKLIQSVLTEIQHSVQRDIKAVELTINNTAN